MRRGTGTIGNVVLVLTMLPEPHLMRSDFNGAGYLGWLAAPLEIKGKMPYNQNLHL